MSKAMKIISIDAFNTLFVSRTPIMKQYVEVGQKHGLKLTESELSQKFPKAYKELRAKYPNYGKAQNIDYEEWWARLLKNLYAPTQIPEDYITDLMIQFSSDLGYTGYQDVSKFLNKYSNRPDIIFVVSSNGDPRVLKVLESLDLLKHFHKVYLSYDIDVSKPSLEFFQYIYRDLTQNIESLKGIEQDEILNSIWHIGDELQNDLEGAHEASWKSILIDRKNEFEILIKKTDDADLAKIKLDTTLSTTSDTGGSDKVLKIDDQRYVINNFSQVAGIIGLD